MKKELSAEANITEIDSLVYLIASNLSTDIPIMHIQHYSRVSTDVGLDTDASFVAH